MSKHRCRRRQSRRSYEGLGRHARPVDRDARVISWAVGLVAAISMAPFVSVAPPDSPMVAPAAVVSDVRCGQPDVEELTERSTTVRTVGWMR